MVLVLLIYIFSARLVAWGKLHPDIFEFAAKAMNVPAAQCLVLEASVAGVTAAVFAKMKCIALTGEYIVRQDMQIVCTLQGLSK